MNWSVIQGDHGRAVEYEKDLLVRDRVRCADIAGLQFGAPGAQLSTAVGGRYVGLELCAVHLVGVKIPVFSDPHVKFPSSA